MIYSIFYKEWIKIRYFFLALVCLNGAVCLKIWVDIRQELQAEHAEMIWYQTIHIQSLFYSDIRYIPLLSGICLAVVQFVPEILQKRLRLSMHLPVDRERLLAIFLVLGLGLYTALALFDTAAIWAVSRFYFPVEVAVFSLTTLLPWHYAGFAAYLGVSLILLEPAWSRRVFVLLVFSGFISLLFSGSGYCRLNPALPWLMLLSPLFFLTVFQGACRFQQGEVS
ncbi:MAG: hypothetical protein U9R66_00305 [Thermodesulfobacteriota bacterium]|nr:hypothetical protein [Thermodesulfobacteriota bacterium]